VTGSGELLTCSPELNSELFRMSLAGLGQCGVIVRARVRLIPAPGYVATHTLTYDDMDEFLGDQGRLTTAAGLNLINGAVVREPNRTQFLLLAGSYVASTAEGKRSPGWIAGVRHKAEEKPTIVTFWDYLDRRTALLTRATESKEPNPAIVATLPDATVRSFLNYILYDPEAFAGIWMFEVSPKVTARHTQPLQKMPSGKLSYELRMQRRASADMLQTTRLCSKQTMCLCRAFGRRVVRYILHSPLFRPTSNGAPISAIRGRASQLQNNNSIPRMF
jgi:cytokinin dehydrogenase